MQDGRSCPFTLASMNASGNENPPAIQRLRPVISRPSSAGSTHVSIRLRSLPGAGLGDRERSPHLARCDPRQPALTLRLRAVANEQLGGQRGRVDRAGQRDPALGERPPHVDHGRSPAARARRGAPARARPGHRAHRAGRAPPAGARPRGPSARRSAARLLVDELPDRVEHGRHSSTTSAGVSRLSTSPRKNSGARDLPNDHEHGAQRQHANAQDEDRPSPRIAPPCRIPGRPVDQQPDEHRGSEPARAREALEQKDLSPCGPRSGSTRWPRTRSARSRSRSSSPSDRIVSTSTFSLAGP